MDNNLSYADFAAMANNNGANGQWNNPFLMWAKYRKGLFKTTLPISLQFHHAQMDGGDAARFLNALQQQFNKPCG